MTILIDAGAIVVSSDSSVLRLFAYEIKMEMFQYYAFAIKIGVPSTTPARCSKQLNVIGWIQRSQDFKT